MTEVASRVAQHRKGDYSAGRAALAAALDKVRRDALTIRRRMTGSEWADRHGILPSGTGAETGKIKLYGYQRGLLDAMCDPRIPLVTVLKAARVGYTRLATLATGYHLEHEGTLCVIAQPTIPDAKDFAKSEIGPMLRETTELARLIRPSRRGDAQDTATEIVLANGAVLRLRGAASDDAFRRYSARFQFADEIDGEGWTPGAKTQGDKLMLLWTRGETFWNRKQVRGSTPLLEGTSRVWAEWLKSDQRHYFVPCPHCTEAAGGTLSGWQYLEWGGPDVPYGIKWRLDSDGQPVDVLYFCRHCGRGIDEGHKAWMDRHGAWRPTARPTTPGHAGFHLWTGMSLTPNAAWPILVREWLEAQKDVATLVQPFVNLRLGLPYKPSYGQELKVERFLTRREGYPCEVPPGVLVLTAGGDTQSAEGVDPRLEFSIWGWGAGNECWLIGHWVIHGDPRQPETWAAAEAQMMRPFLGTDGRQFQVAAATWDSGGHHTAEVYDACATRRKWWAIKGRSEPNGKRSRVWPRRPSKGGQLYMIGGNAARDFAYGSLAVENPGPRYVHFPTEVPAGAVLLDDEYFAQLTREQLRHGKGFTYWHKPSKPHEAGVCFVYAYAALCGLQEQSPRYRRKVEAMPAQQSPPAPAPSETGEPAPATESTNAVRPTPKTAGKPKSPLRRSAPKTPYRGGR